MVGMALGLAALSAWGIERFYSLTAHVTIGATFEETEAPLIEAGVTVFQDLFMIAGFLSLFAISASPADENGRCGRYRRSGGLRLRLCVTAPERRDDTGEQS